MNIDIKEVVDNLKCVKEMELNKWSVTHMEYALKAIEQLQSKIEELNKLLIECANFIDPYNDGDGEAERLINIIDALPKPLENDNVQ